MTSKEKAEIEEKTGVKTRMEVKTNMGMGTVKLGAQDRKYMLSGSTYCILPPTS